jgi:hypothetical protein
VIGVQDLARMGDVQVVLGALRPRQVDEPLEVGADHAVLGRCLRQPLEAPQLALGGLLRLLGQLGGLQALAQLGDLGLLLVALAQFLLDRLQLLAQEVLTLALVELRLDLRLDLRPELDHLEFAGEDLRQAPQALGHVDLLQELLLLLGRDAQGAGDQVRECRGVLDVGDRELQLLGQVGDLLDDLRERVLDVAGKRLQLGGFLDHVGQRLDPGDEVRILGHEVAEPDPVRCLDEDPHGPVGHLEHPRDVAGDSHAMKVVGAGLLELGVARCHQDELALAGEDVVDQAHGALLADREGRQRVRVRDHVAQRQDRERAGQRLAVTDRRVEIAAVYDFNRHSRPPR